MTEPTPTRHNPLGRKDVKILIVDHEDISRPPCGTHGARTDFERIAVMRDLRDFAAKEGLDIDKAARLSALLDRMDATQ